MIAARLAGGNLFFGLFVVGDFGSTRSTRIFFGWGILGVLGAARSARSTRIFFEGIFFEGGWGILFFGGGGGCFGL